MRFPISKIYAQFDFDITGASYAGMPRDNTMMYVTKKVEHLVENLHGHKECLCFIDMSTKVAEDIDKSNAIIRSANPAYAYAKFATEMQNQLRREEIKDSYRLTPEGYYVGSNVTIGTNAYIEPGVLIGHNVKIGNNAVILSGAVLKHCEIGDDFICNENAVIGDYSFTMAEDDNGNKFRIPSLGRVLIGDHVEVGACNDVAIGACGDTILEDYVKLDGLVHIGHEAHLHKNVEITAGAIVAGFVEIGEKGYLGVNTSIRNRISLGANCVIGMGAVVTKAVDDDLTVVGNPARKFEKAPSPGKSGGVQSK
jgi:UDP-3-O-[3-hydroxymyristoyl] glucosamine N-acyltransferase